MSARRWPENFVARLVRALEAIADGDADFAADILGALVDELARIERQAA